ncbi:MAG TPA: hypothetical protein VHF46_03865 [Rubrobacteraceae bacterium]|nr:hypothetical protein [Rubrobacteraceae bacterium]
MSSEERLRREEEEESRQEEPQEVRNVSEPAEAGEPEAPSVIPEVLGEEPAEDLAEESFSEEARSEEETFSEESSEILQEEIALP